jgi:alpha-1,6-mannosyltransferase
VTDTGEDGAAGTAVQPGRAASPGGTRLIGWLAATAIAASVLIMIVISAAGPSVAVPAVRGAGGPPWWHALHLTATVATVSLWTAMALGCAGVIAGLVAVARGARPPVRAVLAAAFLAVAMLTVLPPAGSTDAISYAASGRIAVTGHSPYVMTPLQLQRSGDTVGRQIPAREIPPSWMTAVSVYGPVATAAEWGAAEVGGTSLARITFWLKLEEAVAFGAMILALDRLLRRDPGMRLRAHLLWSVNPLLLWEVVAGGHIDGLAAVFGLLGVAVLRTRPPRAEPGPSDPARGQTSPRAAIGLGPAAAAGLLIGVATGIKVEYALLGLAVAWACLRSSRGSGGLRGIVSPGAIRALAAAAAGFGVVVVPAYLVAGTPAVKVLVTRSGGVTWDTMYQLFWRPVLGYTQFSVGNSPPHLQLVAYLLFAVVAVIALLRFPDLVPGRPAVAPALALSLAWLFVTAFQRPWYDVMAVSLLALYPASWLDWVVLVRLFAGATVYAQAVQSPAEPRWLYDVAQFNGTWLTPGVRLLAAAAFVWFCLSGPRGRSRSGASSGRLPELLPAP